MRDYRIKRYEWGGRGFAAHRVPVSVADEVAAKLAEIVEDYRPALCRQHYNRVTAVDS